MPIEVQARIAFVLMIVGFIGQWTMCAMLIQNIDVHFLLMRVRSINRRIKWL